jgi:cyclic pyranopterin phosphate synthase
MGAQHAEPAGVLSVRDVTHFLEAAAGLGLSSVRFTGGEPLLRPELPQMIRAARRTPGIQEVALTTNGVLFGRRHRELLDAGLNRINISLDSLDAERFSSLTGGGELAPVLEAVDLALSLPLGSVKVNAVAVRGRNEADFVPLAALSLGRPLHVRFIEYMHLNNAEPQAYRDAFVPGREVKAAIEAALGPLSPVPTDPSSPARVYAITGAQGTVGFINPVSEPFCSACSRMRLTADRKVRPCLLTDRELDASLAFESAEPVAALTDVLLEAAKRKVRSGDTLPLLRARTMIGIGG